MPDIAMPDSDTSETNIVIVTRRDRFRLFIKLYWRISLFFLVPLFLLPIAFIGSNNAYKCFYVLLVSAIFWTADVMHPSIVALVPIALSSIMGSGGFISEIYIRNELLDCVGVMIVIVAIEQSQLQKRVAYKVLLIFGCSHYRLSFLLFFLTMFLSMWISGIIACGLMMPLVRSILIELEKMGILEIYQTIGKAKQKSVRHEESNPRPTDFTIFYFLGIAYSSTIGSMATLIGSPTNQILKIYCETLFAKSPRIEFPHFMLLNLPGVLVMETILYFWMNFYFMGMCRAQGDISTEIGMTEEEAIYINTLLATQYRQMGKITFHEGVVGSIVLLTSILQPLMSNAVIDSNYGKYHRHIRITSPCIFCAMLLFVIPRDPSFMRFFRRRSEQSEPLLQSASKACINWPLVRHNINWGVLFIIGGCATLFESLRDSQMSFELEKLMLYWRDWPTAAVLLAIIIFFKLLTEFAPNSCVAYAMLPHVARLGLNSNINPHYLMMAANLSCSMPFHLVTGSPVNAMVAAYVHIPPWKMMKAGVGISLASIVVAWFTVAAWATTVWNESYRQPAWARTNVFYTELT